MVSLKKLIRIGAAAMVSAAALTFAAPAQATLPTVVFTCDKALTSPDASNCVGYYDGNLLSGDPTNIQNQKDALQLLGYTWNGDWNALNNSTSPNYTLDKTTDPLSGPNHDQLNFGTMLSGQTIIGAHFGNVDGDAGNVSVFWLFDLATPTDHITLDKPNGWSNAVLYKTGGAVPEPTTWGMMLLGFGAIGMTMRRRRSARDPLMQVA